MKYYSGQIVYTINAIRGWFDFSMQNLIPENTVGVILSGQDKIEETLYQVKFKEFGQVAIEESNLKLG